MFKWIGGSRQLSQGCALLPVVEGFRGKFDVYERACPPRERRKSNVWHIIFFLGGGVIVYLLQQGVLGTTAIFFFRATKRPQTLKI